MNAQQWAEYRDGVARAKLAYEEHQKRERRRQEGRPALAEPRKRRRRRSPSAVSDVPMPPRASRLVARDESEAQFAARLRLELCPDSVIDLEQHALGVARMVANGRRTRDPRP